MNKFLPLSFLTLTLLSQPIVAQKLGRWQTSLDVWQFSKDQAHWTTITVPHSCNALDGHSSAYYRGRTYYKRTLHFSRENLRKPQFLLFDGAAHTALISVNNRLVQSHRGGYTPFVVPLQGLLHVGDNTVTVMCDNKENPTLIPVSSDFNKNNGLHNPVHLLQMNDVYISPITFGRYRMHVTMPKVSERDAQTIIETEIVNSSKGKRTLTITYSLKDKNGKKCYEHTVSKALLPGKSERLKHEFTLQNPHLWNGLTDPYLYDASIIINEKGKILDEVSTKIGYRFYQMTAKGGFFLNGKSYPLRGVCCHQDWIERASALTQSNYDKDYKIIEELGCNMLRLAHYPHNDYVFRKCDSLGIVVQTEIPWVNVCGIKAQNFYFANIHHQMWEMITNLYNHPSICFWGMWNELDSWGNKPELQDKLDVARVIEETNRLYRYAKSLDPYRCCGFTDDSRLRHKGWAEGFYVDYISENLYDGWYRQYGNPGEFTKEINNVHATKSGHVTNVAEYGAGINPFCHTTDTLMMLNRKDDSRHYEEYGNWIHESHLQQITDKPWLNFTTAWVLFDFAVANREEGYMDSPDGINFEENLNRKYINDKGLITRDRKVKKDVFYLYKAMWNHKQTTLHITSRRMISRQGDKPFYIKVYSNAPSLTLYQNGEKVTTLNQSGEITGVIWTFGPVTLKNAQDTFRVTAPSGESDEVTWKKL